MLSRHPQRSSEWMEDPAIMSISPVAASRANWVRAHSLRGISAYCALCFVSRLGIAILSPTNFAILRIAASRMRDSEQSPLTAAALPSVSTSFPRKAWRRRDKDFDAGACIVLRNGESRGLRL